MMWSSVHGRTLRNWVTNRSKKKKPIILSFFEDLESFSHFFFSLLLSHPLQNPTRPTWYCNTVGGIQAAWQAVPGV